jgi:DNA polymerase
MAAACVRCNLHLSRRHVVFGEGDPGARLMIVGEAPGDKEDNEGRPFRGVAGENLKMLLAGIGLGRSDVYVANVVMCRPPGNRPLLQGWVSKCASYLDDQLRLVAPQVVITLGAAATRRLLGRSATVGRSRGRVHQRGDLLIVPTYHPSPLALNRTPERRAEVASDFRRAYELAYPPA